MRRNVPCLCGTFRDDSALSLFVLRFRETDQFPCEAALLQIHEIVAVFHLETAAEIFGLGYETALVRFLGQIFIFRGGSAEGKYMDGRPYVAHGIETAFLLLVRSDYTVGSIGAGIVDLSALVGTDYALIGKRPEEETSRTVVVTEQFPEIPQSASVTSVKQSVQDLGGHIDARLGEGFLHAVVVGIMLGLESVLVQPRIYHGTLLDISALEDGLQLKIETAFIAVRPPGHTWVILVAGDKNLHQRSTGFGAVMTMPPGQFVHHVQSEGIAGVKECRIGRIMAHAHRIHVHLLYDADILDAVLTAQGTSRFGAETVTVHPLDKHFAAIYVKTVFLSHFYGPETYAFVISMDQFGALEQFEAQTVERRRFGRPLTHIAVRILKGGLSILDGGAPRTAHRAAVLIEKTGNYIVV